VGWMTVTAMSAAEAAVEDKGEGMEEEEAEMATTAVMAAAAGARVAAVPCQQLVRSSGSRKCAREAGRSCKPGCSCRSQVGSKHHWRRRSLGKRHHAGRMTTSNRRLHSRRQAAAVGPFEAAAAAAMETAAVTVDRVTVVVAGVDVGWARVAVMGVAAAEARAAEPAAAVQETATAAATAKVVVVMEKVEGKVEEAAATAMATAMAREGAAMVAVVEASESTRRSLHRQASSSRTLYSSLSCCLSTSPHNVARAEDMAEGMDEEEVEMATAAVMAAAAGARVAAVPCQ